MIDKEAVSRPITCLENQGNKKASVDFDEKGMIHARDLEARLEYGVTTAKWPMKRG